MGRTLKVVLFVLALLFFGTIIGGWMFSGYTMSSNAMAPTIEDGDLVFVNRMLLGSTGVKRGNVMMLRVPGEETQVVRRVIALPGETFEFRNGEVYINGTKLKEPYLEALDKEGPAPEEFAPPNYGPVTLPEMQYFVMGDNRRAARDSRSFGSVTQEAFIGKVPLLWGFLSF